MLAWLLLVDVDPVDLGKYTVTTAIIGALAWWFKQHGWPQFIDSIKQVGVDSKEAADTNKATAKEFMENTNRTVDKVLAASERHHEQNLIRHDRTARRIEEFEITLASKGILFKRDDRDLDQPKGGDQS